MSWIYYLLEANLYLAVFYILYHLVLRRDTHYQLSRAYLLGSSVLAFIIPVTQLGFLKYQIPPPPPPVAPVMTGDYILPTNIAIQPVATVHPWTAGNYTLLLYAIIAGALTLNLGFKLYKLIRLSRASKKLPDQPFKLVEIAEENNAFSFFNYLFIGRGVFTSPTIINHELVHIRQKHSWDIVYLELLKIFNWFNPAVYLLQHSIREIHEFIADQETTESNPLAIDLYTNFLIQNAYGMPDTSLTNNLFNKNLLKRRIIMLHQKRSGSLARLKYLGAVPLCAGMLCISTLGFSKDYGWIDLAPATPVKDSTVKLSPPPPAPPMEKHAQIKNPVRFPPPSVYKTAYSALYAHISKNMIYPKNASNKGGMVIVKFDLDQTGLISNASVAKSAGPGFDAAALKAVESYHTPIKDAAGSHQMGVGFYDFSTSNQITVSKEIASRPDFAGSMMIVTNVPKTLAPPPPVQLAPPPPPPQTRSYVKRDFSVFSRYLYLNTKYPQAAAKAKLNGTVAVDFKVDGGGKVTSATIAQSAGHGFDEAALAAIRSYTNTATFKPGDYRIGINFMITGSKNVLQVDEKTKKGGNFIGEMFVVDKRLNEVRFPPPIVKPDKLPPPPPPAPPVEKQEKLAPPPPPAPPVEQKTAQQQPSDFEPLYKHMMRTVRYPTVARDNQVVGRVFVRFTVDADGHIENIKLQRGLGAIIDNEVIRALENSPAIKADPQYAYTIPIVMAISDGDGNYVAEGHKLPVDNNFETAVATPAITDKKETRMLKQVVITSFAKKS